MNDDAKSVTIDSEVAGLTCARCGTGLSIKSLWSPGISTQGVKPFWCSTVQCCGNHVTVYEDGDVQENIVRHCLEDRVIDAFSVAQGTKEVAAKARNTVAEVPSVDAKQSVEKLVFVKSLTKEQRKACRHLYEPALALASMFADAHFCVGAQQLELGMVTTPEEIAGACAYLKVSAPEVAVARAKRILRCYGMTDPHQLTQEVDKLRDHIVGEMRKAIVGTMAGEQQAEKN